MIDPTDPGGVVPPAGEVAAERVDPLLGVSPTTTPVGVRLLTTPAVWADVADRSVGGREIHEQAAALAARQWLAVRVDDSGGWRADDLLADDDDADDADGRNVPQSGSGSESEPEPGKLAGDARYPEAGGVVAAAVRPGSVSHVRGDDHAATRTGAAWRRAVTEWGAAAPVTMSLSP